MSEVVVKNTKNIKTGITVLRTLSKWADKAALALEKLEGQDTSRHSRERQERIQTRGVGK